MTGGGPTGLGSWVVGDVDAEELFLGFLQIIVNRPGEAGGVLQTPS